jgi:acyl transferase domain-containing protein
MTPKVAPEAEYWGKHLRQTVRFGDGLAEVMKYSEVILLEVGPGHTLSTLARQQSPDAGAAHLILSSTRPAQMPQSDEAFLLNTLGSLWLNGAPVNWTGFHARERRRRVPLPTYPFERQRYWIGPVEDDGLGADRGHAQPRDVTKWLYAPKWEQRPNAAPSPTSERKCWLVFSDGGELGSKVVDTLERQGNEVITVMAGSTFAIPNSGRRYTIRANEREDYARLIKEVRDSSGPPDYIVHLWTTPAAGETTQAAFESHQTAGFYSLIHLAQGLEKSNITSPTHIGVVSTGLHALSDQDAVCPSRSTLLGPCKVLPQEYPNLRCKSIDIENSSQHADTAARILTELTSQPLDTVMAYRDGQRWVQEFELLAPGEVPPNSIKLRDHGVYLITGGLGNIGLEIAQALAEDVQAKLVLIGRSEFPERTSWEQRLAGGPEDAVNRKIRSLLQLEELGAEVLLVTADSADAEQMAIAVRQAYERFGVIHGVIHGAGNTSGSAFTDASHTDRSAGEQHFRPKAHGLFVIEELFRGRELDFVLLLSSLSGVLGGLGLLAYASANIFLDAFAAGKNQAGRVPWISVNWDAWQFPGQAGPQNTDFLYPSEGVTCFRRIVERGPGQVVVSTSNLKARIARWIHLESLQKPSTHGAQAPSSLHPRPTLASQFVAPRTEVEKTLVEIWQGILGISPIGIYDKFFDLGGHSLLAIQLISRMREAFHIELSAQRLFEAPTIVELATSIEAEVLAQRQAEKEEAERTEEMLRLVEQLSEEEVTELLAKQGDLSAAKVSGA